MTRDINDLVNAIARATNELDETRRTEREIADRRASLIRELHDANSQSVRQIAAITGLAKGTVQAALKATDTQ